MPRRPKPETGVVSPTNGSPPAAGDGESQAAPPDASADLATLPPASVESSSNGEPEQPPESALALNGTHDLATVTPGPRIAAAPGLYAVLGLDPSVSDAEIQTTYRRQAARLMGTGASENAALRQLNVAYEVLGNPVRRAEYDRARTTYLSQPGPPSAIQSGAKNATRTTRRRRPRHAVQPRYTGRMDVLVLLVVVAVAIGAGALLIPRLAVINLSALNALSNVLPSSNRRAIDATVTPAPAATRAPTPTVAAGLADRFAGSTVTVSSANPAQNTPESVLVRLRRDNQPAANLDVWATLDYRTTSERWPPAGSIKTDANGAATITFNVGQATPGFAVQVHVFAQVDDQQLSWSTSFTPR